MWNEREEYLCKRGVKAPLRPQKRAFFKTLYRKKRVNPSPKGVFKKGGKNFEGVKEKPPVRGPPWFGKFCLCSPVVRQRGKFSPRGEN